MMIIKKDSDPRRLEFHSYEVEAFGSLWMDVFINLLRWVLPGCHRGVGCPADAR